MIQIKNNVGLLIVLATLSLIISLPFLTLIKLTGAQISDNKLYLGPTSTKNTYAFGYCTFWAAKRREEVNSPIPSNWGDAHNWDDHARSAGYIVDHIPSPYSILETDAGDLGHVAFVESVNNENGSWTISEMNAPQWDVVTRRTLQNTQRMDYNFIH